MQNTDTPADARRQEPTRIGDLLPAIMARIIKARGK